MNTADQLSHKLATLHPNDSRRGKTWADLRAERIKQLRAEVTWEKAWEDTFLALVKEANLGKP